MAPLVLIGNAIEQWYHANPCTAGGLCQIDRMPGYAEVLIIWGTFLLLWLVSFGLGKRPLVRYARPDNPKKPPAGTSQELRELYAPPYPPRGSIARMFWELSHFARVRHVIVGIGIVAVLIMIIDGIRHTLTAQTLALSAIVILVAGMTLAWWLSLDDRVLPVYDAYVQERERLDAQNAQPALEPPVAGESDAPDGNAPADPNEGPPDGGGSPDPYEYMHPEGDVTPIDPPIADGGIGAPPPLPPDPVSPPAPPFHATRQSFHGGSHAGGNRAVYRAG